MARWARIGLLAWGVAALAGGCTAAVRSGPEPYRPPGEEIAFPANPELGQRLYRQDCAWCHGARGEGTSYGPNLDGELDGGHTPTSCCAQAGCR